MKIRKTKSGLKIELNFWEKLFSMHGDLAIPSQHVKSIKKGKPEYRWWELRIPGTYMPRVIRAGTYYTRRGKEFWYWTRFSKNVYTIELSGHNYERLVLGADEAPPSK